ncbi:MAG: hypothetical protein M3442_17060, partial [Chloroflexota bacterium]|nr:hypothetical protein [Chloroflexota bacterium]
MTERITTKRARRSPSKVLTGLSIGALTLALALPTAAFAGDVTIQRNAQSSGADMFSVEAPQSQIARNRAAQDAALAAAASNSAAQNAGVSNAAPSSQTLAGTSNSSNDVGVIAGSKSASKASSGSAYAVGNLTAVLMDARQSSSADAEGTARNNTETGNANATASGRNTA